MRHVWAGCRYCRWRRRCLQPCMKLPSITALYSAGMWCLCSRERNDFCCQQRRICTPVWHTWHHRDYESSCVNPTWLVYCRWWVQISHCILPLMNTGMVHIWGALPEIYACTQFWSRQCYFTQHRIYTFTLERERQRFRVNTLQWTKNEVHISYNWGNSLKIWRVTSLY